MPQPTQSDVHVNTLLSNLSLAYFQDPSVFVADKVFPIIPVEKQSDRYAVYSRADFNRDSMRKRAAGAEASGGGYKVDTTPTYFADVWASKIDVADQVRANADSVFNLDADATRVLVMRALINREVAWASAFYAAGKWTTNWTGVAGAPAANQVLQWNDPGSSPITDIRNFKRTVQLASGGFRPNTAVFDRYTFDTLLDHADFVDRVKYGQTPGRPAQVTLDAIAGLFELDRVLVMDSIVNNGTEGAGPDSGGTSINAGESNAFIASKGVLLCYTPSSPGLMTPGAGYTFAWTGMFGMTGAGNRVKSYYIPQVASTRVEIESAYVHKMVGADMGGFLASVVA